jgi:hypothetical protein
MSNAIILNDRAPTVPDVTPSACRPSLLIRTLAILVNIMWVLGIIGAATQLIFTPFGFLRLIKLRTLPLDMMTNLFHFGLVSMAATIILYFVSMLIWGIFLWIVWHLRKLMQTIKDGKPFLPENPGRIRKIAYAILLWAPIETLFYGVMFRGFAVNVGPMFPTGGMPVRIFLELVFFGLAVLVIAEVFERGVNLQQEQDLTV